MLKNGGDKYSVTWRFSTSSSFGIRAPCLKTREQYLLETFKKENLIILSTKPSHVIKKDRRTSIQLHWAGKKLARVKKSNVLFLIHLVSLFLVYVYEVRVENHLGKMSCNRVVNENV